MARGIVAYSTLTVKCMAYRRCWILPEGTSPAPPTEFVYSVQSVLPD